MPSPLQANAALRFVTDTADHVFTMLHDDGLYRHAKFAKPGTNIYRFDLVTWPGHLAVAGDMGEYVFKREPDMVPFFAGAGPMDARYWAEKEARGVRGLRRFDPERFAAAIRDDALTQLRDHSDFCTTLLGVAWEEAERDLIERIEWDIISPSDGPSADIAISDALSFEHDLGCERGCTITFPEAYDLPMYDFDYRFYWVCEAIRFGCNTVIGHARP